MTDEAKKPVCETCEGERKVFIHVFKVYRNADKREFPTGPPRRVKIPCPACGDNGKEEK